MADIPPKAQRMTDVRPPEASPGEGQLPAVLVDQKPQKEVTAELRAARAPRKKLKPQFRYAVHILIVLVITLIVGFGVMRFSFLSEQISRAIASVRMIAKQGMPIASLPQTGSVVSKDTPSQFTSLPTSTSFTSLLRGASLSDIWTVFAHGGEALGRFQKTVTDYQALNTEVDAFLNQVPGIFLSSHKEGPLPSLRRIQTNVRTFQAHNSDLSTSLTSVKDALPIDFGEYLAMGKSLDRMSDFLAASVRWLEKPHHLVLGFQNSSEMRPSGGFFGSYAELKMASGTIYDLQVHDVTEADKVFSESIVPPQPLQFVTKNWRTADANWYFDFPHSASQTLAFLKKSNLYASSTPFDGFIAVSPRVLEDVLKITGSIELKDRNITLTADNFLREIQGEVVASRADSATAPKSILGEIVSALETRFIKLPPEDRSELAGLFLDWVRYKDIQVFMTDPELQSLARYFGADGGVVSGSAALNTEYLALVDSTIGGEKTNLVLDRTITFRAQIESDGSVRHELNIVRKHTGDKEKERWYRVPNKTYFRALITPGSAVTGASGFTERTSPGRSYTKDYVRDSGLVVYESTMKNVLGIPSIKLFEESEKMSVAGWIITEVGKQNKMTLTYDYQLPEKPDNGVPYRFVFEKQAGTEGDYSFEIDAPVGYHFKENQLPIFEYKTEDIPGRVVMDLTLEKI
ncbi:MAG: DUF4012 domain-containing protein [Patescibacteria group bacterium]